MYRPYKDIAHIYFKKAIICVDSFHVVKHLNDDLSKLKIRIMKQYDSYSNEYYLLKSWKNLLFDRTLDFNNEGKYNKKLKRYINYKQLLEEILDIDSDLNKAYVLKEKYMIFNSTCTLEEAPQKLDNLISKFIKSNIPEYAEFSDLLITWRNEIINSFTVYKGRRINNSVAESLNSVAKTILNNTKGIRNHERRRKRIMYVVNKSGFILK